MTTSFRYLALVTLVGVAGCKTVPQSQQAAQPSVPGEIKPALLIGPDAAGAGGDKVELPVKESARVCLRTAQEFERTEKVEDAVRLYEKARSIDPSCAKQASRRLAVLYDLAGEFGKATTEYEALLKAAPKDADLLSDLGYSHYLRGEWAEAEKYLAQAVQFNPSHKKATINLGLARAQQGKWEESYKTFCAAVRPADAHCNIAFVLATQGKTEDAKAAYREALALDSSLKPARNALARLERRTDAEYAEAKQKAAVVPAAGVETEK